jgi:hypothetical protein
MPQVNLIVAPDAAGFGVGARVSESAFAVIASVAEQQIHLLNIRLIHAS